KNSDLTEPTIKANTGFTVADTKWNPNFDTATVITADATYTAKYTASQDIIPSKDPQTNQPNDKPEGYVTLTFDKGNNGKEIKGETVYYVNPKANPTKKLSDITKPSVTPDVGWKLKDGEDAWDTKDNFEITIDKKVTAQYEAIRDVVPEKEDSETNQQPNGYVKVTFKADNSGNGTVTETVYFVNPNKYVNLKPPTDAKGKTGYEFGSWSEDLSNYKQYKGDRIITASFNPINSVIPKIDENTTKPDGYKTVTFIIEGEGGSIVDSETTTYFVDPNREVKIQQPKTNAKTGYKFKTWNQDTITTAKKYTIDTTVKGSFEKLDDIVDGSKPKPNGYVTVTFVKGDHGKDITGKTVYYVNPKADPAKTLAAITTKPTVTPETGYKFTKWDTDDNFEIKDNKTVIAQYKELDDVIPKTKDDESEKPEGYITVTFVKGDHGKSLTGQAVYYVNPNKALVLKDKAPTAVPNTGYKFARWDVSIDQAIQYKDGAKIKALYNEPGNISTTEVEGYVKVEFKPGNNGSLTGTTNYWIKPGVEVNVPAPTVKPNTGYKFDKWDKDLTVTLNAGAPTYEITAGYTSLDDIIPQKNTDGSDKPDGYHTVTFKVVNGTTSGQTVFYVNGKKEIDLTNTANGISKKANIGYTDEGVNWSPAITNKKYTGDAEYTFTFKPLPDVIEEKTGTTKPDGYVTVEFMAGDNGSLEGGDKTYYVNPSKKVKVGSQQLQIPKPTPATNYKFDNWYEAIDKNEEIKTDKKFVARFKLNKVTITYVATGATSGTVPQALSYDVGSQITLAGGNDLKKDNYVLKGWNINGQIYAPGATYKIEANTTATAEWDTDFHTVNFDTDGGGYIASQKVKHNELIKPVTNPEKENYTFTGWKVDGQDFDPATSNVTKDITLVAQYVSNVVEQTDPTKPPVPDNFVKVIVKTTEDGIEKATDETKFEKTFWVNPEKVVTITVNNPKGKVVNKNNGEVDYTWQFKEWDKELTQKFTATETIITAKYQKLYDLPEVKPIPEARGGFIYTDLGKNITDDQYKKEITLPNGYSFDKGTSLEIVESTKPNVNKSGRYYVSFWVTYPDGKAQKVEVLVYVGEARPEPKPPTPEPGYPGEPGYPSYPGRPIPM
ncbi:InlB B-repeat-containing protein, partial [Peptoniphilus genitalis]